MEECLGSCQRQCITFITAREANEGGGMVMGGSQEWVRGVRGVNEGVSEGSEGRGTSEGRESGGSEGNEGKE